MASPFGNSDQSWEEKEKLVYESYHSIIEKVIERREIVLTEMRDIRGKIPQISNAIQQLENEKIQIEGGLTANMLSTTKKSQIMEINNNISDLQLEASAADIEYQFAFDDTELNRALSTLGAFEKSPTQYLAKTMPQSTFAFSVENIGKFSVHEASGLIAIIHNENTILYIDLKSGGRLNSLTLDLPPLSAIEIINFEEVVVSTFQSESIAQFQFNPRKKLQGKKISETTWPLQSIVSISYDNQTNCIYAISSTKHSYFILNRSFKNMKTIMRCFVFPQCLHVSDNKIFILDCNNPCLHILCKITNTRIRSILPRGYGLTVYDPVTFSIDRDENVIIGIPNTSIKVFSPFGQLICTISEDRTMSTDSGVISVFVTKGYDVIVLSKDPKIPIKIY